MKKSESGKAALIIFLSFVILVGLSLLPWSKMTGGKVKDFNLISDILPESVFETDSVTAAEMDMDDIDPELLKAQDEAVAPGGETPSLSAAIVESDSLVPAPKPSRSGDMVILEDYTAGGSGLGNLRQALSSGAFARIAVVGDSYIEGDIFTQDLRNLFQSAYGGEGVGYVNMHSDFPGFRRTVKQGGSGWKAFSALKKADNAYMGLSEQYFIAGGSANSTYEGTKAYPTTSSWSGSKFLFISRTDTKITYRTDGDWIEYDVKGDSAVQVLAVDGPTSRFDVRTPSTSLVGLGVWLDGASGVGVDCMSSRGFSGITLSKISSQLCYQMSRCGVDYNLIILEFGINAMSANQKNYSVYSSRMVDVINHVRRCYPRADILLMGIGDRGEKRGSEIHSMSTASAMVEAQRDAARKAHCLFWDTREAMGGNDAVVEWSRAGQINKDYIHMTHKGGARLADLLFKAIQNDLK